MKDKAKDKAIELVEKFLMIRYALKQDSLGEFWEMDKEVRKDLLKEPKQCALICVDEILGIVDLANKKYNTGLGAGFQLKQEKYWKNVRNEIEKL